MVEECLLPPDGSRWVPFGEGIEYRLFHASDETGRWTVLFRCQPGSYFGPHRHLGAGEYYVISGRMTYRMGEAGPGTYGYEPIGVVHEHTAFPELTELFFSNYGPIAFLGPDGGVAQIVDAALLRKLAEA